jgi:hypothetical protein
MKLSALEKEIIRYKLEAPDCMAEVMEESMGIPIDDAFEIICDRFNDLIEKLEKDKPLDIYEKQMVSDIATDNVYADCAQDAIGYEGQWEGGKTMTAHWAARIANINGELCEKLEKLI